jgi:hypothetical protein
MRKNVFANRLYSSLDGRGTRKGGKIKKIVEEVKVKEKKHVVSHKGLGQVDVRVSSRVCVCEEREKSLKQH